MIGPAGDLLGIGSLQIQQASSNPSAKATRQGDDANMIVPIDLLKPILDDLITIGRPNRPARPWLGLYATEIGKQRRRDRACHTRARAARRTCARATSCRRSPGST